MLGLGSLSDKRLRLCASLTLAMFASVLAPGCGGKSKTVSVQGTITYQGKPVSSGLINFLAPKSRPLGGGIESDGTYSAKLPPGEYQVRIDAPAPLPPDYKEGMPAPKLGPPLVPEKYANFSSSGLTATVEPGGRQTIDFKLP